MTFTYVVLVKMDMKPSWQELYTIAFICTLACEKVREIVSSEPVAIRYDSHLFLLLYSQFQYPVHVLIILSVVSATSFQCGHGICGILVMLLR